MKKILLTTILIVFFAFIPMKSVHANELDYYNETIQEEYYNLFNDLEIMDKEYLEEWFLSYVELCDYYGIDRETVDIIYSEEEIELMLRVIETETHGCTFLQKVNVANVLLNRYQEYETFGYTNMTDLITHTNQFAYGRTYIMGETRNALNYAFEIRDTTDGAIGFRSDKKIENWNKWDYSFYDGAHWFYKLKEGKSNE